MALPEVQVQVQDGGTGVLPASSANAQVKMGVCSLGVVGQLYGFNDAGAAVAQLGLGPLTEAVCSALKAAGGPVYAMPVNPSQPGALGTVTFTAGAPGSTGTVTPHAGPAQSVAVKIGTGGASGVATYQVSVNGGPYGAAQTTATTASAAPGVFGTLTFPTGTYVANDVWTQAPGASAFTVTGTGTVAPTGAFSASDNYNVVIALKSAGAPGTATFTYSLDGGNSTSPTYLVPSSGVFPVPGAGFYVTFAGSFMAGDQATFQPTTAGFTNTDLTPAFTALLANPTTWGWVHVVGAPATSVLAATLASVVDAQMQAGQTRFRFARAFVECPNVESDATIEASFANFASVNGRVAVGCGDANMVSPVSGRILRRNPAWAASNRCGFIQPGEDPSWIGRGPLSQVVSLTRDEFATPGLDASRFITCRTEQGKQGYYLTNVPLMSPAGSDFQYIQHGRVMDQACTIARQGMLQFLNGSVRVDKTTGFIDPRDAATIEASVNAQLNAGIVATGDCSACTVAVSRTQNILSTNTLPVTVRIVGLGYAKNITINIGYMNPAITTS